MAGNNSISRAVTENPTVGNQAPVVNRTNLSTADSQTLINLPKEFTDGFKGVLGEKLIEPVPTPIYYAGDSYLSSDNNSGIICSRDEHYI